MLLLAKVLLVYLILAGALYLFARLAHNYLYTDIPDSLTWRAPTAGAAIWFIGLALPLGVNYAFGASWPVSFNELFITSAGRTTQEFPSFIVAREGGREVTYTKKKNLRGLTEYQDAEGRPLPGSEPVLIGVDGEGQRHRFEIVRDDEGRIDRSRGAVRYRSAEGLEMPGETLGTITTSGYGRFILNLFVFLLVLGVWFAALWLLLLLQWPHALGFAVPLALGWTFMLNYAV